MEKNKRDWIAWLNSRVSLGAFVWNLIPAGVVAALTAWAVAATDALNQFGPASWIGAAFLAFVLVIGASATWEWRLLNQDIRRSIEFRARPRSEINPLDGEFKNKRIYWLDLPNPITRKIEKKRFIDCELIGPANLFLLGVDISKCTFAHCDYVVVKPGVPMMNAIPLIDVEIINGVIANCTLFIGPRDIDLFSKFGARFATLIGDDKHDALDR